MRDRTKWFAVSVLVGSGLIAFACGGATTDANHGVVPSAASTESAASSTGASATSTTNASASAIASTSSAPPLAIVPMSLVLSPAMTMRVDADGTVTAGGQTILKFVGAELRDAQRAMAASVDARGSVAFAATPKTSRFNEKDELELPDGTKLVIADDGAIDVFDAKGKPDSDNGSLKFAGFKPIARRAAAVLVAWSQLEATRMMANTPKLIASVNRMIQTMQSASATSSSAKPKTKP